MFYSIYIYIQKYSFIVAKLSHEKEHHLYPMIHHYLHNLQNHLQYVSTSVLTLVVSSVVETIVVSVEIINLTGPA